MEESGHREQLSMQPLEQARIHAGPEASEIGPFQITAPAVCTRHTMIFKMADFVVQIHEVVNGIINSSRGVKRKLNGKIGGELLQLTRAVVKKHTLPQERAYKYHLAQAARILSRSVVSWNKSILRKLRRRPNGSAPWTVKFAKDVPFEVYECCMPGRARRRIVGKKYQAY